MNVTVISGAPHIINQGSRLSFSTHSDGPLEKYDEMGDGTTGDSVNGGGIHREPKEHKVKEDSVHRGSALGGRMFLYILLLVLMGIAVCIWYKAGPFKPADTPQSNKAYKRIFEINTKQSECLVSATCNNTGIDKDRSGPSDETLEKMAAVPLVLLQIKEFCNSSNASLRRFWRDLHSASNFSITLLNALKFVKHRGT